MITDIKVRNRGDRTYLELIFSNGRTRLLDISDTLPISHPSLTNLDVDVHEIYHNDERGDLRYYPSSDPIPSSDISVDVCGHPTYGNLRDWMNNTQASGKIDGGTFTDNSDGTVKVGSGNGFIRRSNSALADVKFFRWVEELTLSLTDEETNYICVNYNAGSPEICATITKSDVNNRSEILLGKVYRSGNDLYMVEAGMILLESTKNVLARFVGVDGEVVRSSGYLVAEKGERYIETSDGVLFAGLTPLETNAIDTTGADTLSTYYYDGVALEWVKGSASQIDNLQWNDVTLAALETLTANRYGVFWLFGDPDGAISAVYGQGDYTLANAEAATLPLSLPNYLVEFGFLAAKVIIQKSDTHFYSISSAYDTAFTPSGGAVNDPNAIHDNVADEIHQVSDKAVPISYDEVIIEDSADAWAKKRATLGSLPAGTPADNSITNAKLVDMNADLLKGRANAAGAGAPQDLTAGQVRTIINVDDGADVTLNHTCDTPGGAGTDTTAIHDNVGDEIHQIADKAVPVVADEVVLEDSADGWAKKRATIESLPKTFNIGIEFLIDGGGSVITTGSKGYLEIPFTCTIIGWTILGDQSGSIEVDVQKSNYADFPVTASIAGTEKPTLSAVQKNQDLNLTSWTTAVTAGDILEFIVDSITTCERVTVSLRVQRTV